MSYVKWNDELSVDVDRFDRQHRNWIQNLNSLFESIREGAGKREVGEHIEQFRRYTYFHLEDEERVLVAHDYPHIEEQRAEHNKYRGEITDLKEEFERGDRVRDELMRFMKQWLLKHIEKTDMRYSDFLRSDV